MIYMYVVTVTVLQSCIIDLAIIYDGAFKVPTKQKITKAYLKEQMKRGVLIFKISHIIGEILRFLC